MTGKFNMDDYVPVNERVDQFYKSHPEGSIQSEIIELTPARVTIKAYAFRTPDDPRPGIGHSSLDIPGSTPYTRGSEVENAETSAWGRAIAALGFEVKRGIASAEEVRNKQSRPSGATAGAGSAPRPAPASDMPEFPPPLDEEPTMDEVLAVTGGTEVPVDLQDRIKRAEAKGQQTESKICPEHGPDKVKQNKRGLYCATKVGDGWCEWSAAA